ncbi:hypothetical protein GGTG_09063 [Gaeumannomyces tritici R3-111a-1]|uniref:AA1-like domain-containing protein n=1 Tax=Gaeumannomyces tritici (strain R3-111a-1) TaxID=644352 RepID=J3P6C2_GAET3|nr:hypothetical protein GGTG_09063 [Gaeumannomyces tritici R3-111a-1]EJT72196.1 hypothetical protein GGTG_09063 [Gaeumannomyces tritici R3-111a-1]
MHLTVLTPLCLALPVAMCFQLSPAGLDGVYRVTVNGNGVEEHHRLGDVTGWTVGGGQMHGRRWQQRSGGKIPSRRREVGPSTTSATWDTTESGDDGFDITITDSAITDDTVTTNTTNNTITTNTTTNITISANNTINATSAATHTRTMSDGTSMTTTKPTGDASLLFDWTRGVYWRLFDLEGTWECKTMSPPTRSLNATLVAQAYAGLDAQCDRSGARGRPMAQPVKPKHHFYARSENVVAFFCNFAQAPMSPTPIWCDDFDRISFTRGLARRCGIDRPGWVTFHAETVTLSYGLDEVDHTKTFCAESHH